MKSRNYLQDVKDQYEDYPYPERNPLDELRRIQTQQCDCLDRINYYCFQGTRDFRGLRVLVAGGGTGDSVIFLAEQLRDMDAHITYLDISTASMKIAQQRAEIRGLTNITWRLESLLDLPRLDLGTFDYINCSGVLHHLSDPVEGLAALVSILAEDGAMTIMVYAKYGRQAVYQIQDLMRIINQKESDNKAKLDNCLKVLKKLPDTNSFSHLTHLFPHLKVRNPIEIYDLFLHSQDRAYSIPELYEYVEGGGVKILHLLPGSYSQGNQLYKPSAYLGNDPLCNSIDDLPLREKQAIAELLHGGLPMHTFYAAKSERPPPTADDLDNIPFLNIEIGAGQYDALYSLVKSSKDTVTVQGQDQNLRVSFRKSRNTEGLFKYMDGNRSLRTIFKKIMSSPKFRKNRPSIAGLSEEFKELHSAFSVYDWMFLRGSNVLHPVTIAEMQSRIAD